MGTHAKCNFERSDMWAMWAKSQTDLKQNQLDSFLGLIFTNTIKKFQPLTYKIFLLILIKF